MCMFTAFTFHTYAQAHLWHVHTIRNIRPSKPTHIEALQNKFSNAGCIESVGAQPGILHTSISVQIFGRQIAWC